MHATRRRPLRLRPACFALPLALVLTAATNVDAALATLRHAAVKWDVTQRLTEAQSAETQLAVLPYLYPYRGTPYPYWYSRHGCGPVVPTLRTMQNYTLQSHQWKGDYPVCQPLYAPTYGHFETQWRRYPGDGCGPFGPMVEPDSY